MDRRGNRGCAAAVLLALLTVGCGESPSTHQPASAATGTATEAEADAMRAAEATVRAVNPTNAYDEMQLDRGQPSGGYWDGTATLEERDGAWLINDFTTVRHGGNLS